jgi:hypothetical protein
MRPVLPSVRARMRERYIVNVRVPPDALADELPGCLDPQEVNGWGIASFCLLDLRRISIAPLPPIIGPRSMSCAARYAVLDEAGAPSVFVPERQTASRLGAWFTRRGFSAPHGLVEIDVSTHQDGGAEVHVRDGDKNVFGGWLRPRARVESLAFDGVDDFAAFLAMGERSYGQSRHDGRLTVLDLHKSDAGYEPQNVERISGSFIEHWKAVGGEVDSAFRTTDARYEWKYYGLIPEGGRREPD